MRARTSTGLAMVALLLAGPVGAQKAATGSQSNGSNGTEPAAKVATQPNIVIQHYRPQDQRGLNMFETPKEPGAAYTGFKLDWGAAFTQQFQDLEHSNTATPKLVNNVNANELMKIGGGFNNANANLYLNAQLAPGIRVALASYLSSRHHNETWVKDGYLLIDGSPIDVPALNTLMEYVTLRVGHFEINYGDAHFRRSDNGNAMYNPFVGNYILDSFTTEIGGELYLRAKGFMVMGALTGGEIRGQVKDPEQRHWANILKLGFDRQLTQDLRVRLTGSRYATEGSLSNTLFSGDRAGSRYYFVLENTTATETAQKSSGLIAPGFSNKVTAYQLNPFIKFKGLELFGVLEEAEGRTATETANRTWKQSAYDAVYRFLGDEKLYVAGRFNRVEGELTGIANEVSIERYQLGGGWFVTGSILLKGEYVHQKYFDFPSSDIRNGGRFKGFIMEGVVAF